MRKNEVDEEKWERQGVEKNDLREQVDRDGYGIVVAWHQDRTLPLRERREQAGRGPWSVKEGVNYAHAPREAPERVVALRLHLDDSNENNGPLRVLPGTHRGGVLTDDEVHRLAEGISAVECLTAQGGVVIMRPLVIHASSKAASEQPRRVLHIEYAATEKIAEGLELTVGLRQKQIPRCARNDMFNHGESSESSGLKPRGKLGG
jgi:ectoine hydroxylase-related dioxygenase (phytanoyl-CoA dioxygenase family)